MCQGGWIRRRRRCVTSQLFCRGNLDGENFIAKEVLYEVAAAAARRCDSAAKASCSSRVIPYFVRDHLRAHAHMKSL